MLACCWGREAFIGESAGLKEPILSENGDIPGSVLVFVITRTHLDTVTYFEAKEGEYKDLDET